MKRLTILFATLMFGCATFPAHMAPSLPQREPIWGTSYTVSVRVLNGDSSPMCMLPDAANEISCYFSYGWLEGNVQMFVNGGYRYLDINSARLACADAAWSISGPGALDAVPACSRALLMHRWIDDSGYKVIDEENQ